MMKKALGLFMAMLMLTGVFCGFAEDMTGSMDTVEYMGEGVVGRVAATGPASDDEDAMQLFMTLPELEMSYVNGSGPILVLNEPFTWTVYCRGGQGPYTYRFKLYSQALESTSRQYSYAGGSGIFLSDNSFTCYIPSPGRYLLRVEVMDEIGNTMKYDCRVYTTDYDDHRIDDQVKLLAAQCRAEAQTEYDRVKWVHDWLCRHVEYDYDFENESYLPEGALLNGRAVCQGYTLAANMLFDELGIESIYVYGTAMNSAGQTESHGWNMVKIAGVWYHMDATWDDQDEIYYAYFLADDAQMSRDHVWVSEYAGDDAIFPDCPDNSFYCLNGVKCASADEVRQALSSMAQRKLESMTISYTGAGNLDLKSVFDSWYTTENKNRYDINGRGWATMGQSMTARLSYRTPCAHDFVDGYCTICGCREDGTFCGHESVDYYINFSENAQYVPVDNACHLMTGSGYLNVYCTQCRAPLGESALLDGLTEFMSHEYDAEGCCGICGHINTCTHENTEQYTVEDDFREYLPAGPEKHYSVSLSYVTTVCRDCGMTLGMGVPVYEDAEEDHAFEDGVCSCCGYDATCDHVNTNDDFSWYGVQCTATDNLEHRFTGIGRASVFCEDCEREVSYGHMVSRTWTERHTYDEDGLCGICKHLNTCEHTETHPENIVSDGTFVPYDSRYHLLVGSGDIVTVCDGCGMRLSSTPAENIEMLCLHFFFEDEDECAECGYIRGSDKLESPLAAAATSAQGCAVLSWTAVDGAFAYDVYRAEQDNGDYALLAQTTETAYTDAAGTVGNGYRYKVIAVAKYEEDDSESSNAVCFVFVPGAPVLTVSNDEDGRVVLTWTNVTGADSYEVKRGNDVIACVTGTTWADEGAAYGTAYTYTVCGLHGELRGVVSNAAEGVSGYIPRVDAPVLSAMSSFDGYAALNWNAVENAVDYGVYRTLKGGCEFTLVGTTTDVTYTDAAGVTGTEYDYIVFAFAGDGYRDSLNSNIVSFTFIPGTPVLETSNDGDGRIVLTWTSAANAAGYELLRGESVIASVTDTAYTDETAEYGVTYSYTVRAVNGEFHGHESAPVQAVSTYTTKIPSPALTVRPTAKGYAGLTWTQIGEATGYRVYRQKTGSTKWSLLKTTANTSYTNTSGEIGTEYRFKVIALAADEEDNSFDSNIVSFVFVPAAPVLTAGNAGNGMIVLDWTAVTNANSYVVTRDGSELAVTEGLTWTDETAEYGVTYIYTVCAVQNDIIGVESAAKEAVSAYTLKIASPVLAVHAAGNGGAALTWNAVEGATGYSVYRLDGAAETWSLIAAPADTCYTDSTGAVGCECSYKVVALAEEEEFDSFDSNIVSFMFVPASPVLTAEHAEDWKIVLSWTAVADADGYQVLRDGTVIAETADIVWTDEKTEYCVTYTYTVRAVEDDIIGVESAQVEIVSYYTTRIDPVFLEVTETAKGYAALTWREIGGATGYNVYRRKPGSTKWSLLKTTTNTAYTNTSGTIGSIYGYKVVTLAEDPENNSFDSNVVEFMFLPAAPVLTAGNAENGKIVLSWNAVANVDSYIIARDASVIATTEGLSWTDETAEYGVSYSYTVRAVQGEAVSIESAAREAVSTYTLKIASPVLSVSATAKGYAGLTWNEIGGATGYSVYRQKSGGTKWSLLKTTSLSSYTNTSGTIGTEYQYKVVARAADAELDSYDSNIVSFVFIPAAPVLAAENTADGKVTLTWNAIANADGYELLRDGSVIASLTQTDWIDDTAEYGVTYSYSVRALMGELTGAESTAREAVSTYTTKIASPVLTVGATAKGYAGLSWTDVEGATGYTVYRRKPGSTKWTALKTTTNTAYTNTSGAIGSVYGYKIVALAQDEADNSFDSNIVEFMFVPASPSLTAGNAPDGKVTLNWNAIADADGYEVLRNETVVAAVNELTWTDETAEYGVTYSYKVRALRDGIAGVTSAAREAVSTYTTRIKAPVLSVSTTAKGYAGLTWNAVEGATGYSVYRQKAGSTKWTMLKTTGNTSYTNTSGSIGTSYSYKVVAEAANAEDSSFDSNIVSFTFVPAAPVLTAGNDANGRITLSWTNVEGAGSYEILRGGSVIATVVTTGYTDESADYGVTYSYAVRGVVGELRSAESAAKSAVSTYTTRIPAPVLTVSASSQGYAALSWSAVDEATGYRVYRCKSENGSYTLLSTVTRTTYTNKSGKESMTYWFRVVAVAPDEANSSFYSNAVTYTFPSGE